MKNNYFSQEEIKALMNNKTFTSLYAIATPEGLHLCPCVGKDNSVLRVLPPLKVNLKKNVSYSIEMGGEFCKVADALDFSKASVVYDEGDIPQFVVGKKGFRMAELCPSDKRFDLNLSGYEGTITLSALDVKRVKNVAVSCSYDNARYFMNGVYLDPENGAIVATDGRRMAYQEGDCASGLKEYSDSHGDFIIPRQVVPYLDDSGAKISWAFHLIKATEEVKKNGGHDAFAVYAWYLLETGDATYLFNPIDGHFPNWKKVCPAWSVSDFNTCKFDFEAVSKVKKQKFTRITFRDGSCFQDYNGMELNYDFALPSLPEGKSVSFDAELLKDGSKLFGKKADVQVAFPETSEAAITKAVEFKDVAESANTLHFIIMPLNPNYC